MFQIKHLYFLHQKFIFALNACTSFTQHWNPRITSAESFICWHELVGKIWSDIFPIKLNNKSAIHLSNEDFLYDILSSHFKTDVKIDLILCSFLCLNNLSLCTQQTVHWLENNTAIRWSWAGTIKSIYVLKFYSNCDYIWLKERKKSKKPVYLEQIVRKGLKFT